MYSKAKYIVGEIKVRDVIGNVFGALVFSEDVPHIALRDNFVEGTIVGAGFFHSDDEAVHVYGMSTGLNIQSRPEDAEHVARAIAHTSAVR